MLRKGVGNAAFHWRAVDPAFDTRALTSHARRCAARSKLDIRNRLAQFKRLFQIVQRLGARRNSHLPVVRFVIGCSLGWIGVNSREYSVHYLRMNLRGELLPLQRDSLIAPAMQLLQAGQCGKSFVKALALLHRVAKAHCCPFASHTHFGFVGAVCGNPELLARMIRHRASVIGLRLVQHRLQIGAHSWVAGPAEQVLAQFAQPALNRNALVSRVHAFSAQKLRNHRVSGLLVFDCQIARVNPVGMVLNLVLTDGIVRPGTSQLRHALAQRFQSGAGTIRRLQLCARDLGNADAVLFDGDSRHQPVGFFILDTCEAPPSAVDAALNTPLTIAPDALACDALA